MDKIIRIENKINNFKKKIIVDGDKSISIRWALLASQALGKSTAYNLLRSEDVINTINCLKKLGVKIIWKEKYCEVFGNGLNSFKFKKNIILNAGNSGTLARLIMGLLVVYPKTIKIFGDRTINFKRPMGRIIDPLEKFGCKFEPKNKKTQSTTDSGYK